MDYRKLGRTSESIPVVGMGTWEMGGRMSGDSSNDAAAVEALRLGLKLGMSLIDTAEMYGAGHSEEIVSKVLKDSRDSVFLASKVSPSHFEHDQVLRSAEHSLQRLGVERMDLYQLHWPSPKIPIGETMRAMEKLVRDGKIRHIGVSNFSVAQIREAQESLSRESIVSNQVEYSLVDRWIEPGVLPFCQREGITVIAYSPLGKGRIPGGRGASFKQLDEIARKHSKSRSQVALNWLLSREGVVVIPKAIDKAHVRENAYAAGWKLNLEEIHQLERAFPAT
ncbi:MAG TPA: aldo/keto reductase [Candidatus Bathyarchaeia archaeon]|nr:aldo/keto reductase [Candidatus Bathyarchaeia archaeon]